MNLPYSFLTPWLERRTPLAAFIDLDRIEPNRAFGGFLAIQRAIPIHESVELAAESLSSSWVKVDTYVKRALEIICADEPQWLDSWETEKIQEQLGSPPVNCLPIYLVSVGEGTWSASYTSEKRLPSREDLGAGTQYLPSFITRNSMD